MLRSVFALLAALALFVGCDHPNPLAPAEPIGDFPQWGLEFTAEKKAGGDSMFNPNQPGPAPTGDVPNNADLSGGGGSAVPAANPNKVNVAGGDLKYGQQVFLANCARCHGPGAEGGNMPMIGVVANLTDAAWHDRTTDAQIASTIAHGKGKMPGFMGQLDKRELDGVVAFLRSLKK